MGCASSAPLTGDAGPLGELKGNMIESGEKAFHDMGDAAEKTMHQTMDTVKEAVHTASHEVQEAMNHLGSIPEKAVEGVKKNLMMSSPPPETPAAPSPEVVADAPPPEPVPEPVAAALSPLDTAAAATAAAAAAAAEADELDKAVEEIMGSTPVSPSPEMEEPSKEMFRPTPVPSFEKPATNEESVEAKDVEGGGDKSAEEMADQLIKETEDVTGEGNTTSETPSELDPPLTKWEALADVMVELPPRVSIDLGTGQIYTVVQEEGSKNKHNRTPMLKEVSSENPGS